MASIKTPGLILRKIPFSETSVILKVFTREAGLVTLMAKGAKRPKSKFHGLLDYFNLNQFLYPEKSRTEIHTLTDLAFIRDYPRLKSDPSRQALSHVFLELYLKYMHGPGQSLPHFELLVEHLEGLDGARESGGMLRLCDFLLGLCAVSGFSPQFTACVHCGAALDELRVKVDPDLGGPVCRNCAAAGHGGMDFPARILRWMDRVQREGQLAGHLPKADEMQAESFLLSFLGKHAGGARPVKSLDFHHHMLGAA